MHMTFKATKDRWFLRIRQSCDYRYSFFFFILFATYRPHCTLQCWTAKMKRCGYCCKVVSVSHLWMNRASRRLLWHASLATPLPSPCWKLSKVAALVWYFLKRSVSCLHQSWKQTSKQTKLGMNLCTVVREVDLCRWIHLHKGLKRMVYKMVEENGLQNGLNPFNPSCSGKQYFPAPSIFLITAQWT